MKKRFGTIVIAILMLIAVSPGYSQNQEVQSCGWQGSASFVDPLSFFMPDFDSFKFEVGSFGGETIACEWPTVACANGECRLPEQCSL